MTAIEVFAAIAAIGTIVGIIGGLIARDRYVSKQIRDGDDAMSTRVSENVKHLHERIDRLKDDTVRISTHDRSVERIERALTSQSERLDKMIGLLAQQNVRGSPGEG